MHSVALESGHPTPGNEIPFYSPQPGSMADFLPPNQCPVDLSAPSLTDSRSAPFSFPIGEIPIDNSLPISDEGMNDVNAMMAADINPFGRPRTGDEKQRHQVYCYGKTLWELYVGKPPVVESDLNRTPSWVERLVRGCCFDNSVTSMVQVISQLEEQAE